MFIVIDKDLKKVHLCQFTVSSQTPKTSKEAFFLSKMNRKDTHEEVKEIITNIYQGKSHVRNHHSFAGKATQCTAVEQEIV